MNFLNKKKDLDLNYIVDPSKDCVKYIKSSNEKKFTKHSYEDSIVRADFKNFLISIIFNTNSIEKTIYIVKKFLKKTACPEKIQFCIKIDNNDATFEDNFLKEMSKFELNFVILSSPQGRGYIDLWQWVNFLFASSSKYSKFIMNISDEMYVEEEGWDNNLEKYEGLEDDNIYRLRTSVYRNRNYHDLWECGYAPDTTAIYTRKYLTIQKNFSPCFGPDNGQQIVAYYLSKINYPRHTQFLRDKVINDITFNGQGTNIGLKEKQLRNRRNINHLLWLNIFTYKNQTDYFRRARKIQIEIIKAKFKNISFKEYNNKYVMSYITKDNQGNEQKNKIYLSKEISYLKLFFYNISRYDFFKYNTGYGKNKFTSILFTLYFLINKKFIVLEESKSEDILLGYLINSEKKLRNLFLNNSYYIYKFIKYSNNYLQERDKRKKSFYGWGLHDLMMNIMRFIYYFIHNITLFILCYVRLSISIIIWLFTTFIFLLLFWKFFVFFKYFVGRVGFKFRRKSHIACEDYDQSKSIIIKGD